MQGNFLIDKLNNSLTIFFKGYNFMLMIYKYIDSLIASLQHHIKTLIHKFL